MSGLLNPQCVRLLGTTRSERQLQTTTQSKEHCTSISTVRIRQVSAQRQSVFSNNTYAAHREVMTHKHVERRRSVHSDRCRVAAAFLQEPERQFGALLGLFLEHEFRELETKYETTN